MKIFKNSSRFFVAIILSLSFIISASAVRELVPIGHTTGIRLSSEGALIIGFSENLSDNPAKAAGLAEGDVITRAGEKKIFSNNDLLAAVEESRGNPLTIQYLRNGKTNTLKITPKKTEDGHFLLGVLVRDSIAGIGTLTFLDPETNTYGALGHGVSDSKTGTLLPLRDGELIPSVVSSVKRGKPGLPGELCGEFDMSHSTADIRKNTEEGIFGKINENFPFKGGDTLPTAEKDELHRGAATILSNIEGDEVKEYDIEITGIYFDGEKTKNMLIRATDPELLKKTGGIVCGMSGSPIIQDGKLVGAVTHVLVNDPTKGYGIFIDNMLDMAR